MAIDLLGRFIVRRVGGRRLVARIVETEAYLGEGDRASHAWHGRITPRTASLFRPGGVAYVFLIYGLHCCFNAVAGEATDGTAVLIRAAEPVEGEAWMSSRRGLRRPPRPGDVAGGPGKLCQALSIDRDADGVSLRSRTLSVTWGAPPSAGRVAVAPRVGVDYAGAAAQWPLRFALHGNRHVSRPRPVER